MTKSSDIREFNVLCIGTAIVDSIIKGFDPKPVSAAGFRAIEGSLHAGGEAVNVSCAAAKLGNRTAIMCHLGIDGSGDIIKGELLKNGVDMRHIRFSNDHPTPVTTMFVNDDGTRRSVTNLAHRYNFHPEADLSCFKNAQTLLIGSLFRAPFDDPEIINIILKEAKANDLLVFADTKLPNFNVLSLADISDSLKYIDYITPNEDEARYYTGMKDPEEMADVFLDFGVRNVIIKLGASGCYFKNKDFSLRLPAYNINAVDATGAGDNFIAGFATEILRGASQKDALIFANACGAICASKAGAGTALKSHEQVEQFIASHLLTGDMRGLM